MGHSTKARQNVIAVLARQWHAVRPWAGAIKALSDRHRRFLLALALLGFGAGIANSIRHLPVHAEALVIGPLAGALLLGPLMAALNGAELWLCGRAVGVDAGLRSSIRTSSIAAVANLLPLPAGLLLRGGSLMAAGGSLAGVSQILLLASALWIGMALGISGAALAHSWGGVVLLLIGSATVIVISWRLWTACAFLAFGFVAVRIGLLALLALRLMLCFGALHNLVNFTEASAYTLAGVLGSAVTIVPAGLGITEAIGALLAQSAGQSAAVAFVALSLARATGLIANALTAAALSYGPFAVRTKRCGTACV